jgi:hypothetical protein
MTSSESAAERGSREALRRVRELNALRDRGIAAQSPGSHLDHIEARTALLQIALTARMQLAYEAQSPHKRLLPTVCSLVEADNEVFRRLLRDHQPTPSGHCQRCHLPAPATFIFYDWPCPTVQLVEAALQAPPPIPDHPLRGL